ncbi:RHS repeat-associated core domain-containing protein [Tenacibaculum sp. 190524A02b]|uniref:RHS repeat-associated core domain-containing protein n=1 Tax=Tenacibaculum vairaonense TaxID=3137860 RepID=A0ABM9PMM0_9FLAO
MKKLLLFLGYITSAVFFTAQAQVELNTPETGEHYAPTSIVLKPGFSTTNFWAYIVEDPYTAIDLNEDENYVFSRTYQSPLKNTNDIRSNRDVIEQITYFDGLGRAKQSIGIKQSPNKKDIVTHIGYDDLGRQDKEFLPFAGANSTGAIVKGTSANYVEGLTQTYYAAEYPNDFSTSGQPVNAYSQKLLEDSPLSRVLKQAAPGHDWRLGAGHEIEFDYQTNSDADAVKLFTVTTTESNGVFVPSLAGDTTNYAAGELYKTITKDENHDGTTSKLHTTEEYKNKEGQVILKRTFASINSASSSTSSATEEAHDTYYIYDDFGNLTYVLPPKVVISDNSGVSSTELSELCYQYKYDHRNRLVEKKIPGKEWEYIVYDKLDRPVLTQDANLRAENKWLFTKYDILGRVAYTGVYTINTSRNGLQTNLNGTSSQYTTRVPSSPDLTWFSNSGITIFYNNNSYSTPSNSSEIYTVNYYDNYSADRPSGLGTSITTYYGQASTSNTKGLATISKVRVLGTKSWITTVTYYDEKARPIYVYSKNDYLQTIDIVESKLDFVGKVLETKTTHKRTGKSDIVTLDVFSYDHTGRMTKQTQQINSQATETIVANTYDKLGQLKSKEVGGTNSPLQTVDYSYNVRGWLKNINEDSNANDNDLFNFRLHYNDVTDVNKRLYNGNIAQTSWNSLTVNSSGNPKSTQYSYTYDALNRIIGAIDNTGRYNLGGFDASGVLTNPISYDKNGNILSLLRKGHLTADVSSFGTMDNLAYTYDTGNKLEKVTDTATSNEGFKDGANTGDDYEYDANGNMIKDHNKGISNITYNHLNLPTKVTINGKILEYIYDASGTKIAKINKGRSDNPTTEYAGNFIYKKTSDRGGININLEFFNHPEGYVKPVIASGSAAISSFDYVYQYKDHLGNVRLSYTDANKNGSIATSEIIEESNYYPFGLKHKGYNNNVSSLGNATAQKFKYNGKELNESLDYNMYEYESRHYDASLGRFVVLDRLSEEFQFQSPYVYAANDPIAFIDKNGDGPILAIVGAVAGALIETGTQIAAHMATGKTFGEALNNLDYADIGISAGEGGLAGLTNGASLLVTDKLVDGLQAGIDIDGEGRVSTVLGGLNGGERKDALAATAEFAAGKLVGKLGEAGGNYIKKEVNNASSNLVKKTKNLRKANNVAKNGNYRSKAGTRRQAFKEFSIAKDKSLLVKKTHAKKIVNSKMTKEMSEKALGVLQEISKGKANQTVIDLKKDN